MPCYPNLVGFKVTLLIGGACLLAGSACLDTTPSYDQSEIFIAHGPLEPTKAVEKLQRLTHSSRDEMFPALSPDLDSLLFVTGWFQFDHSMIDPILALQNPLNPSSQSGSHRGWTPSWLPDASSFVYVTNESGAWQLVRSRSKQPDGRFDVIMTDDVGKPMNPSVSPDGKQVAFSRFEQGARRIMVSNLDGSHIRVLSTGDYPSFSPNGDEIVYQDLDSTGQWQLFSISPQGQNPVQLTFSPYASIHPAHDPSGELLVFGSTIGQESRRCKLCCGLFLMRIDNGDIMQLIGGDVDADWPSWGKDGWIYFTSNESGDYDVWRLRIADDGSRVPAVPSGV